MVGNIINSMFPKADLPFLHGPPLFVRDHDVGINPKEERKEGIQEFASLGLGHLRAERDKATVDSLDGIPIGELEGRQILITAVFLHIEMVHGEELQQALPLFQRAGHGLSQSIPRERRCTICQGIQICRPGFIFPLHQRQEDFFFCSEIVIDGRPGKGRRLPYLLDGDVLETHRFIKTSAGRDDFFSPFLQIMR